MPKSIPTTPHSPTQATTIPSWSISFAYTYSLVSGSCHTAQYLWNWSHPFMYHQFVPFYYCVVWIDHNFSVHSCVDRHWGCFQMQAVEITLLQKFLYLSLKDLWGSLLSIWEDTGKMNWSEALPYFLVFIKAACGSDTMFVYMDV